MKIGIYDPYLDSLGGGERYMLTVASHWSKKHDVSVFWDGDRQWMSDAEYRFGLDVSGLRCVPDIFGMGNTAGKLMGSRQYDVILFLTDGSIPMTLARRNILHIQVPFAFMKMPFFKKSMYQAVVTNSVFTRVHLDPSLREKARVIYPPVGLSDIRVGKKKRKMILSVGRFTSHFQAKKQEVMIDAFIGGLKRGTLSGYELVLAGGLMESDREYYGKIERAISGYPVRLFPNCSRERIVGLYGEASLYWHAAGFGETDPTRMEHFGISTVEAMAAGTVPLAYAAGGQPEIINDGENGYLWHDTEELLVKTAELLGNPEKRMAMGKSAVVKAGKYGIGRFTDEFDRLLEDLRV